jgi:hypothetical protein
VVNIDKELPYLKGHELSCVDIKNIPEQYLIRGGAANDYSLANLQEGCTAMAIGYSTFVFYHVDLSLGNIIVENDPILGAVEIIDLEAASCSPRL